NVPKPIFHCDPFWGCYNSTANLSDAIVYAFLANQPNGSQLVHEDLEQIHEDDLEEMDLKWQLALLSMRARKECKGPRNQESRDRNQDSSRRIVNVEDIYSQDMVAIDGAGFDWSYMADEEVPTNLALMAFSDSEVHNTCSNTCLKSFETLKTQLDNLRVEFNKSEFNLATYKRGLASVEEQLVFYKKNEVMLCDQIAVLKRDASFKDSEINALNIQIEKLKKEKESNQIKIDNFENASKSLDKLIGSQISDNNRKGVGYNVVPPPPTGLFAPPTIDLSNSGLKEFQQPEFEGYGLKENKGVCENSSNEIKKTTDAPIIEDWVSDCDEDESEVRILKSDNVQQKPKQANQPRKVSENPRRNFVPTAVLTKSGIVPVSAARPINTVAPKSFVNAAKTRSNAFQKATGIGKEFSNPLMADSLPKTILPTKLTATVETVNDGEQQIYVTVDGKTIAITEASVRRHLQLADADGGDTPGSDETKKVYGKALTKLVKKVKYLEDKLKSTSVRRKERMVISNDEKDLVSEYPSKQGRITETKFEDVDVETEYEEVKYDQTVTFQQITPTKVSQGEEQSQESSEVQLDVLNAAKILADASRERVKTYKSYTRRRRRSIVSSRDSTAGGLFSTAEEILSSDERIAHKLNKEEMAKAVAREEQEMIDFEKALELQKIDQENIGRLSGVEIITEGNQVFEDMLKGFNKEDLVTLWSIVKERFRSAKPTKDMERALWVELKRLFDLVHHVSSTRGHDIYMLSRRLQVEEDNEMEKDLVMKIFIEDNKPRS
ncbi:hypothetical protein Tco_0935573, partial [Tanacetum coccineum]